MTKVKICGIKTMKDALAAIDAGADYLGFNFYPKSIRFIEMDACMKITAVLKREHPEVKFVGVFVNSPVEEVRTIMEACSLDLAQLHGDETPEMVNALEGKAFKAFRGIPQSINGFAKENAPALLVDAAVKGVYGGTGVTADWSAAAELAMRYPLLLAGGLTPENVAQAVRQVRPWGVDVASGVEVPPQSGGKAAPGEKDAIKMSAFVQAVRKESKVS
jgi:phosphoribosylanthranilate isomerase